MKINKLNIKPTNIGKVVTLLLSLWLILSTCSMQNSLHHFVNSKYQSTEQSTSTTNTKKKQTTTVTAKQCVKIATSDNDTIAAQKTMLDLSNPYVALLISTVVFLFLGISINVHLEEHPFYSNTSQLKGKYPLFIEFQNLRI